MNSLGENVANARKMRDLTQKELAEEIGVNPSFISLLENDKSSATLGTILKIANALEISYKTLVGEDLKSDENKVIDELIDELIGKTQSNRIVWTNISIDYEDKNTGVKLRDVIEDEYKFYCSFSRLKKYDIAFMKDCCTAEYKEDNYYIFYFPLIPKDGVKVATKNTIVFLYASGKNENGKNIFTELATDESNSKLYSLYELISEDEDTEAIALNFLKRLKGKQQD